MLMTLMLIRARFSGFGKADIFDVCENRGLHFSCNPLFLIFRGYLSEFVSVLYKVR